MSITAFQKMAVTERDPDASEDLGQAGGTTAGGSYKC